MNIELKPIAEKKIRQLGGDVCGVLVRDDSGVMAVSEHGRCTRLDAGVMGPVAAAYDYDSPHWPVGTNILTAEQAEQMLKECLGAATTQPEGDREAPEGWKLVPIEPSWAQLARIKTTGEGAVYSDTDHGCDIALCTHPQTAHQGSVPDLESESLQAVANKVCGELPEGWIVGLYMENGAAWVEAIKPSGYTIDIDRADLTMAEQVIEALKQAAGAEQ